MATIISRQQRPCTCGGATRTRTPAIGDPTYGLPAHTQAQVVEKGFVSRCVSGGNLRAALAYLTYRPCYSSAGGRCTDLVWTSRAERASCAPVTLLHIGEKVHLRLR